MSAVQPTAPTPSREWRLRPWRYFAKSLSLRLWLAVVAAVMVLTVIVGWAWRQAAEPPLREIRVRNEAGQLLGSASSRPREPMDADTPRPRGAEFTVPLSTGQVLEVQVLRPQPPSFWNRPPFGFFWMLAMVGVGVALATYPMVRHLTRRLEALQRGVERWGDGDLSARVPVSGDDEVAFLANRFNHAAGRVEALVTSHKSLLANASHELRSPLARIRMGLELMKAPTLAASRPALPPEGALAPRGGPSALEPSVQLMAEIERNIAELDLLVDEILLASRLDAQQADVGAAEPLDLTGLAAEECAQFSDPPWVELHAEFDRPPVLVSGVPRLLRRLVRNLVENARRHGDGPVQVHLAARGTLAVLRVCDQGPGVPPAERERIFEPFYRLAGASEHQGGVGLGLALVKSIAERHGGTVRCDEQPGGGACFTVSLPLLAGGEG